MTAYQRGDRFEKRVLADLALDGYAVWQTRGSKSPTDLIGLKPAHVVLVQVKSGDTPITHDQWNALLTLAYRVHATPILATRNGRGIRYRQLTGIHIKQSTDWPSRPWHPDAVLMARHAR